MLEFVLRVRCDTCLMATEQMVVPKGFPVPGQFGFGVPELPPGWTRDNDQVGCPEHPARRIHVAPAMSGLKGGR